MNTPEYNQCVTEYSDAIFRFVLKNLRDEFEAENIVQNTFEKLWIRRDKVDLKTVKPFLFKVAYNNMIDVIRKNKRSTSLEDAPEPAYDSNHEYTGIQEIVNKAVAKLPEKQRTVVMLRDYEGYDYRSIGDITGMTESQVKINIFRARKFLKAYLNKMEVRL